MRHPKSPCRMSEVWQSPYKFHRGGLEARIRTTAGDAYSAHCSSATFCARLMHSALSCSAETNTWDFTAQVSYCFDVVGLREHIESNDRVESVTTGDQFLEISAESGWITGDVGNARGTKGEHSGDDGIFRAGTRRIEQKEINRPERAGVFFQPVPNACGNDLDASQVGCCYFTLYALPRQATVPFGEIAIAPRKLASACAALHPDDPLKPPRQRKSKQPNPAVKIDCPFPFCSTLNVVLRRS